MVWEKQVTRKNHPPRALKVRNNFVVVCGTVNLLEHVHGARHLFVHRGYRKLVTISLRRTTQITKI